MIDRFEELLQALGKIFRLALHVDRSHACSIQISEKITVQLQLDLSQEHLWIFLKLIELPPGKFRENVLREALKANALPDPRAGLFGYLAPINHLALFQRYPLDLLNGEHLSGFIGALVEMGNSWQIAISQGQSAPPMTGFKK